MKKKNFKIITALTLATILLCSCTSKNNNQNPDQQIPSDKISNKASSSYSKQKDYNATTPTPTVAPTPKPKKTKGTKLFEKVYVPFASREKGKAFEVVESFVESTSFKNTIVKPSNKNLGSIKVFAKNGDYVYFTFYSANDLDVIMDVGYYQKKTKKEVCLSNYSTDNSTTYDTLTIEKNGKASKEVSSIKKQREFLFKKSN